MAKQAKDGGAAEESGFDFSKFLDLDEEDSALAPSTDTAGFDYHTIPHAKDEIVTGGLDLNLEATVDSYIKAGKVSWGDKRTLRRLAGENRDLEANLRSADKAILDRADGYHAIVSNILREKNEHEGFALDDQDPYDSEPVHREEESLGSRAARIQSSDLFREIEKLELHRGEINGKRIGILEEIKEIADRQNNESLHELDDVISQKLDAIIRVQDITKASFTAEDEALFDRGVEELTGYIQGDYDPLAEEDEYDDLRAETPLSNDGHSEGELEAIRAASASNLSENLKRGNPFGADMDNSSVEEFSSEESPEALFEAFGADTFDPEPQTEDEDIADPEDVDVEDVQAEIAEDQAEISEEQLRTPTEPISVIDTEDFLNEESEDRVSIADDLSAEDSWDDVSDDEASSHAEIEDWGVEDDAEDLPYTEFLADQPEDSETAETEGLLDSADEGGQRISYENDELERFEGEGGSPEVEPEQSYVSNPVDDSENYSSNEQSESDTSHAVYAVPTDHIDFEINSQQTPVRAVIFEELKAKYGLSFSFEDEPNSED